MSDIKITVSERGGRKCASSGSKWEPIMGYSRAVRSGNIVAVTGTVGINADGTYAKSMGEQTRRSLAIVAAALEARSFFGWHRDRRNVSGGAHDDPSRSGTV